MYTRKQRRDYMKKYRKKCREQSPEKVKEEYKANYLRRKFTDLSRSKARYQELKTQGYCVCCGETKRAKIGVFCKACWFKYKSVGNLGTAEHGTFLYGLFRKQKGKCFYTGKRITPGKNAWLDHSYPRSKYPKKTKDKTKVHWVSKTANMMKHDLTHKQFIRLCAEIAIRFGAAAPLK